MRTDAEILAEWPFPYADRVHGEPDPVAGEYREAKTQRLILEVLLDIRRAVLKPAPDPWKPIPYVEWLCPRCQATTFDAPTRSNAYGSVCQKCAEALNLNRS